jgi:uncharacterized protein
MYYTRKLFPKIEASLKRSPITLLTGARQTGKTTLVKEIAKKHGYNYVTFDNINFLSNAKSNPIGFIEGLEKPVILDEVQRAPEIFLTIKQDVDENRDPGRYLLTGSANPLMIPQLAESFVGRMEILYLYPLSYGERHNTKEHFIKKIFSSRMTKSKHEAFNKKRFCKQLSIGGFPSMVEAKTEEARESWSHSYLSTILSREVKELANIEGLKNMPTLLEMLATRVCTTLNTSELSRTIGIANTTLNRYLRLLETLFIVQFQRPWFSNLGKRLVKSPKTYLVDSAIHSHLLGLTPEKLEKNNPLFGAALENFIVSELQKQSTWHNERIKFFHFRTQTGIEVDIVLENAAGDLIGIEVKSKETIKSDDFKGLQELAEIAGSSFHRGIVLYTGKEQIPFASNMHAVPLTELWS